MENKLFLGSRYLSNEITCFEKYASIIKSEFHKSEFNFFSPKNDKLHETKTTMEEKYVEFNIFSIKKMNLLFSTFVAPKKKLFSPQNLSHVLCIQNDIKF